MMTLKKIKNLLFLICFGALTACQSGVIISESNLSVSEHRRAIVTAIGEPRLLSQNGREISSHFHDENFKYLEVTPKTKKRYYTKVTVLGARRPYDIAVEVFREERDPESGAFQDVGLDEQMGLARARAIRELLNQSRDKTHTIDGTNPF